MPLDLAILPIRSPAVFPHTLIPLTVGRSGSLAAIENVDESQMIAVVAQRDARVDEPRATDLYSIGCAARILRKVADTEGEGSIIALAEGVQRIRILEETQHAPFLKAQAEFLDEYVDEDSPETAALVRNIKDLFEEIVAATPNLSSDVVSILRSRRNPSAVVDFVSANLPTLSGAVRQQLLEELDVRARMEHLVRELLKEREDLRLRDKIRDEVGKTISDAQRKMLLREQLKAIRHELGEEEEGGNHDLDELEARLHKAGLPEDARREAERGIERLSRIPPASAEYTVARTYLDWLASLPWRAPEIATIDLHRAREILDEDHFDLDKIKERILEHIAVISLKHSIKGPILCFVGPPGVGKTSIGQSIARAMGRKFARISLGGMRDEAEIRGHRRTYVGALPGQIIRAIRQSGTRDPVLMLDEVDKLGRDFRGDPASALLEVLDPAQNSHFRDHYLDVHFDLSQVLFITTANVLEPIPPALYDRMEVLELAGYSEEDKTEIALRYLVERAVQGHGLASEAMQFTRESIQDIIRFYTHEAGVRELERMIASICRKQATRVLEGDRREIQVTPEIVRDRLGAPKYRIEQDVQRRTQVPGVAVALAWTPVGGEILFVEAARVPRDRGEFTITGQVQKVMEESSRAALTWLRGHSELYGIPASTFSEYDVHVHVPAGAVPKDGPSAGIVMVAALVSLFSRRVVKPHTAMTGEITLSGNILAVGGIKEKILAAKRSGLSDIILPAQNRSNVAEDVPLKLRKSLSLHFVETIEEALDVAFGRFAVVAHESPHPHHAPPSV